jgi:hypothetical protein
MTKSRLWTALGVVVVLLLSLTLRLNYVRSTAAGELFWNAYRAAPSISDILYQVCESSTCN